VKPSRRDVLRIGGGILAGLPFAGARAAGGEAVDIEMRGNADGSRVWFEPIGVLVRSGQTVRWTNRDPGNSHTATAYHPGNDAHALRIPEAAEPWNSDYLLPDESFSVVLQVPGIYDYFCIPHEHAGMVGRIVVAAAGETVSSPPAAGPIPDMDGDPFPSVEQILGDIRVIRR
jgi:plastocyanin